MASKRNVLAGLIERLNGLRRIVPDNQGRIRASIEASTNTQAVSGTVAVSTVTTVTTITNWGATSGQAFSQQQSNRAFQSNFRSNLVQS